VTVAEVVTQVLPLGLSPTQLVSHAIALLLGLLFGAVVDWEDLRDRWRRDERGGLRPHLAQAGVAAVVAIGVVVLLVVTPLELRELARWPGIRWCVAIMAGVASAAMLSALVHSWPLLTRRTKAIASAVVTMVAAEGYFQVEAYLLGVPLTGIRNLVMLLSVTLLALVQFVDWDSPGRRR
jgi:hypothetical protein